jgi:hypothetical protein
MTICQNREAKKPVTEQDISKMEAELDILKVINNKTTLLQTHHINSRKT